MATTFKTRIVKIGNSQGVRIPKLLLDQTTLGEQVELEVQEGQIVIREARALRADWDEQFSQMAERGDDQPLDDFATATAWDDTEWVW